MKYIILGLVQGFTEFLPVSSSGHLVIAQKLLGLENSIAFDITVHLATLLAVVAFFWRDILKLINKPRLVGLLLLSTAITGAIGVAFSDQFEAMFSSTRAVGFFLLLTGVVLFTAEAFPKGKKDEGRMTWWDSILIGLGQAAAICPGLSRSGTTISTGLMRGLDRELAARYSFLLSIPTIFAAGLFQIKKIAAVESVWPLILGAVAAFVSGYIAIWLFMGIIQKYSLRPFAYYCFVIGLLVLVLL
jgi:undecaprenyl-diphosphatase